VGSSGSDFEKFSYGRHSNDVSLRVFVASEGALLTYLQWLFGGFSVRDTVKGVLDRKNS